MRRPRNSRNRARTLPGKWRRAENAEEGVCELVSRSVLGNTGVRASFATLEGEAGLGRPETPPPAGDMTRRPVLGLPSPLRPELRKPPDDRRYEPKRSPGP